jgi:formylglycine-generating enzyme required for sulfatase activity
MLGTATLCTMPTRCAGYADFATAKTTPPNYPVTGVSYCDAWAYCAAQGKRLCGGMGGVEGDAGKVATVADEWTFVCGWAFDSAIGSTVPSTYPYGDSYDPLACNTNTDDFMPPGTKLNCHPPTDLKAVVDLVGNAEEWTNTISSSSGSAMLRGGHNKSLAAGDCKTPNSLAPTQKGGAAGIRCCSGP